MKAISSPSRYRLFSTTASSAHFRSVNPVNNSEFFSMATDSDAQVEAKIKKAHEYFRRTGRFGVETIGERMDKLSNVHALLGSKLPELAELMTLEMGKPIG